MVYQRNKKAKGDPPFQQQSKRGYRRNPVTCPVQPGQQPASPAWWPVNRAATGLQRRSQQIRFAPGQPGSRPACPVLRPVHRAATGRQPAANRKCSRTSKRRPVTGPVRPASQPGCPVCGPVDRVCRGKAEVASGKRPYFEEHYK
jgi:hypothetical protein